MNPRLKLGSVLLAACTLGAGDGADAASPALARCELSVDGRIYVEGRCRVVLAPGGSFTLNAGRDGERRPTYFAYLNVEPDGSALAYWNETPSASYAHAPLGRVTRAGACWSNARARLCAWK